MIETKTKRVDELQNKLGQLSGLDKFEKSVWNSALRFLLLPALYLPNTGAHRRTQAHTDAHRHRHRHRETDTERQTHAP